MSNIIPVEQPMDCRNVRSLLGHRGACRRTSRSGSVEFAPDRLHGNGRAREFDAGRSASKRPSGNPSAVISARRNSTFVRRHIAVLMRARSSKRADKSTPTKKPSGPTACAADSAEAPRPSADVAVRRLEAREGVLGGRRRTVDKLRQALEAAGVEFTNGSQPGVRLKAKGPSG
jgi:hypothetical protein